MIRADDPIFFNEVNISESFHIRWLKYARPGELGYTTLEINSRISMTCYAGREEHELYRTASLWLDSSHSLGILSNVGRVERTSMG